MSKWMVTLAMASVLSVQCAWAADEPSTMKLKDFRVRNDAAQTYMVLGALAVTGSLGLACPHVVTVREWKAGLLRPDLDVQQPWVELLGKLMQERGCKVEKVESDT